jgi:hypothetical protein
MRPEERLSIPAVAAPLEQNNYPEILLKLSIEIDGVNEPFPNVDLWITMPKLWEILPESASRPGESPNQAATNL